MESGLMGAFFYHQFWGFPNFCEVSQVVQPQASAHGQSISGWQAIIHQQSMT
jgi:hypothetical protein